MNEYMENSDNFSRGCRSCQQGKWLCVFLTYLCSAKCTFCPSPIKNQDKIHSAFGSEPDVILDYLKRGPFNALSFSGGDCFLVFDRLLEWLRFFKNRCPEFYFWVYTSGLPADEEKMKKLSKFGLDEIRFNLTAVQYFSQMVLDRIKTARALFPKVAVEIPSIPEDYQKITSVLPYLDKINVDFLNLHEFIIVPEDPRKETVPLDEFVLNKNIKVFYDIRSLDNTRRIRDFCRENRLNIKINNCSLQKKENQMYHRRLVMAQLFKHDWERITKDGLLETFLIYTHRHEINRLDEILSKPGGYQSLREHFRHPSFLEEQTVVFDRGSAARLLFIPPMGIDEKRTLYQTEMLW